MGSRRSRLSGALTAVAIAGALLTALAPPATAAVTTSITSVTLSGTAGAGGVPTLTLKGKGFGNPPRASGNDVTTCGTFADNGSTYGTKFHVDAAERFRAGYADSTTRDCVGLRVAQWIPQRIIVQFGSAYGQVDGAYLDNGVSVSVTVKGATWSGVVTGLSAP